MSEQSQETQIAVLQEKVGNLERIAASMDEKLGRIEDKLDDTYVKKDDFLFWRNILISGIILTIFLGIISQFIKQ